jgi:DNA (cytosine-5)-methyltransferase 1
MNGQMDIFSIGKEPLKIKNKIRLIEVFGGIGSQAKALERIGADFEHYRLCEFDPYAVTSYNAIHGTNFTPSDVTELKGADLGIVDVDRFTYVLTYSYPCQSLSLAGKQEGMVEGSGTQSSLLWEVKRLLEETAELPQILVMENVPQVLSDKNKAEFYRWVNFLESKGYTSKWEILNSRNYGVPQNRDRCFMVSWLGDYYYYFPQPKPLEKVLRDLLQPDEEIDEKYYLSEKGVNYLFRKMPYLHKANSKNSSYDSVIIPPHGWNGGEWKQSDIIPTIDTGVGKWHILLGTSNIQLYDVYNGKQIDETCIGTITSACSHNGSGTFCVKNGKSPVRRVTPKECWRFMNFDDTDYENAQKALNEKFYKGRDKSGSQLYKQAGNSIVVAVLEAIFKEML